MCGRCITTKQSEGIHLDNKWMHGTQVWRLDPQQCQQSAGHIEKAASVLSVLGDDPAAGSGSMVCYGCACVHVRMRTCACVCASVRVCAFHLTDASINRTDFLACKLESRGHVARRLGRKWAGGSLRCTGA